MSQSKVTLNEQQRAWCEESRWDFSDLRALFLNCTLKKSPELSHTQPRAPVTAPREPRVFGSRPQGQADEPPPSAHAGAAVHPSRTSRLMSWIWPAW